MGLLSLTESERNEILNLHNNAKIIKEQVTPLAPAVNAVTSAAPADRASKIIKLQTLLKTKYNADLGVTGANKDGIDGTLGPKTLEVLSTIMKTKAAAGTGTGTGTTPPAATGTTPPAATGTTPPAATGTTPPAATGTTPPAATGTTPPAATGTTPPAATGTSEPEVFGGEAPATTTPTRRDLRRQRQDLRRGNRREMQDLKGQQKSQ